MQLFPVNAFSANLQIEMVVFRIVLLCLGLLRFNEALFGGQLSFEKLLNDNLQPKAILGSKQPANILENTGESCAASFKEILLYIEKSNLRAQNVYISLY